MQLVDRDTDMGTRLLGILLSLASRPAAAAPAGADAPGPQAPPPLPPSVRALHEGLAGALAAHPRQPVLAAALLHLGYRAAASPSASSAQVRVLTG